MIDLTELAGAPRLLVALDFDGTLAPIVAVPSDARALPAALEASRGLAALPATTVDGTAGVRVDAKPAGMAVHVRAAAPDVGAKVLDALRAGPAAQPGIVATPGKAVLDLAVSEVNKGVAIDRLRGDATVFFAGDDVTDETALARLRPGDVGVKVGEGETTARYRVADPAELATLLQQLLAARAGARSQQGDPAPTGSQRCHPAAIAGPRQPPRTTSASPA